VVELGVIDSAVVDMDVSGGILRWRTEIRRIRQLDCSSRLRITAKNDSEIVMEQVNIESIPTYWNPTAAGGRHVS
jgi:hypothetical protein